MAKPSAFLQKVQAKRDAAMRIQRLWTIQQSEDMMLIAAAKAFGFGPKRALKLRDAYREVYTEWAAFAVEDGKNDYDIQYTRGKLDAALKAILGDAFEEWEKRYPGVET